MLTSSSPNPKLFEGSLSLNSTASDPASLLSTLKLESVACATTKFPEINNNGRPCIYDGDIQFLGTMTNPLGLTLKPPAESSVDRSNGSGNLNNRSGSGDISKEGSKLDRIQAQFRQKLESEKESKLREIFEKSVKDADRRIERITGGVGAASSNARPNPAIQDNDPHLVSSGGMMKEFFKERRDMEKIGDRNLTALPNIQTHLKSKRQQYQQQQYSNRISSIESNLKPPRHHAKRNTAASLKPKPLSPIAPVPEYRQGKFINSESENEGFNSTYSLSSSTLNAGDLPADVSLNGGADSSVDHSPPPPPPVSKLQLPPVKGLKKGRSPSRDPVSSPPRGLKGTMDTSTKTTPTRKAPQAKRQQKAAAKAAAMEAENMKYLDKIIEAERRKSAQRRRRAAGGDALSEYGAGDAKPPADAANGTIKKREDEIMRQINQKMAELERLRSQNKDLGDRSRGSSRFGTPVGEGGNDFETREDSSPDPRQGTDAESTSVSREQRRHEQHHDVDDQENRYDVDVEEQRLRKRAPTMTTTKIAPRSSSSSRSPANRQGHATSKVNRGQDSVDEVEDRASKMVETEGRDISSPSGDPVATETVRERSVEDALAPLPGGADPHENVVESGSGFKRWQEEEQKTDLQLVECLNCGRRFAEDRIEKHQKACSSQKARRQYDTRKHRVAGQDHAAYALNDKYQKEEPKKETNWRAKREQFIRNIRYARMASKGNAAALPPPPPDVNPDYVQCPHCQRRFNESAAERHIPKCKDLKTKTIGQMPANRNSARTVSKPPSNTRRR